MKRYKILWDTDGEDINELGLPEYIDIPEDFDGDIANSLSDDYGWCIDGFELVECENN